MDILQGVRKQRLRPRAVVGYGVEILLPSPPNYVSRSPGKALYIVTLADPELSVFPTFKRLHGKM